MLLVAEHDMHPTRAWPWIVVAVAVVDTVDEAVDLANACDYSLTSGVWTKDIYTAFDVAGRIRASEWLLHLPLKDFIDRLLELARTSTDPLYTESSCEILEDSGRWFYLLSEGL